MTTVSVVYSSRHGSTREIAERIAWILREDGLSASASSSARDLDELVDAYVIGSAVYVGDWLKDAKGFLTRNADALATRPVWLFSSGPLGSKPVDSQAGEPVKLELIAELTALVHAREHRLFFGAYDPTDQPAAISERLVRMMPASRDLLIAGDFRDWPAINAWAHAIAAELVPVPALA